MLHGAAALMVEGCLQREGAALNVLVQALHGLDSALIGGRLPGSILADHDGKEALEVGPLWKAHGVIDRVTPVRSISCRGRPACCAAWFTVQRKSARRSPGWSTRPSPASRPARVPSASRVRHA